MSGKDLSIIFYVIIQSYPLDNLRRQSSFIFPFHRWGNWGTERWAVQGHTVSSRARTQTRSKTERSNKPALFTWQHCTLKWVHIFWSWSVLKLSASPEQGQASSASPAPCPQASISYQFYLMPELPKYTCGINPSSILHIEWNKTWVLTLQLTHCGRNLYALVFSLIKWVWRKWLLATKKICKHEAEHYSKSIIFFLK